MGRDGDVCVFAGDNICDAAHLLPKSRGDAYISFVLQDRLNSYDPAVEPTGLGINSVENGIFLSKNLHGSFGRGLCAFLKTPNFALETADIPRVEEDPMPPSRITLHHLVLNTKTRSPVLQWDARINGTGISPPSTIILDFMYGVAAYRHWGIGQDINEVMQHHFTEHYNSIPIPPASPHSSDDDSSPESDEDDDDDECIPNRRPRGRNHSSNMSDEMLRAMDNVLMLSMLLKGTTPELMATERQRREEVEELHMQEASRVKVQQWMQSSPDNEFQSNASHTRCDVEH
ncbi:hypothetical protein APHAL10511_003842 [Amanita phalloides]|nr:hypothetical protein APHAL10511_003842 [Amanita phalloides]